MTVLAIIALAFAAIPAMLFWRNVGLYLAPQKVLPQPPRVSILIPARNEEASIAAAVEAALASVGVELEVLVLDDQSTDRTAEIVRAMAVSDQRVALVTAPQLPAGWCGKQHACWILGQHARYDLLLFVDADVRVAPNGIAQAAAFLEASGAALVSGVPRQETGTFLEKLLIPLIHFVLLGFLPLAIMRKDGRASLGAGCGQFFLAQREAYFAIGGHAAVKQSLHDGVTLPRAFRRAGYMTDLFDATHVATCRMYRTNGEVWRGLAKNATEGLAAPGMIIPATLLLVAGQLLPWALLSIAYLTNATAIIWILLLLAIMASYSVRIASALRYRQSWLGALLHPVAILMFLAIQWYALARELAGHPATWKGRHYRPESAPSVS